jgi:hypothetical protein
MTTKYIAFIFFIAVISSGCNQKCRITCTGGVSGPVAINYTFSELDTVIVNLYTPNDSFNNLVNSATLLDSTSVAAYNGTPAHNVPCWLDYHTSIYGSTTGDTLLYTNGTALNSLILANYDIEIIVPSNNNKTYKYSKITFEHLSQYVYCKEGGTLSECNSYLASYKLNGTQVYFPSNSNGGSLYFSK